MSNETKQCYVYLHRRLDNDVVFYIGKGTSNRCHSTSNRSAEWHKIKLDAGGIRVEFLERNLTTKQAIHLENLYLSNPDSSWQLVNITKRLRLNLLTFEFASEYFYYDETSPSCLKSKVNRRTTYKKGDNVGVKRKSGWVTTLKGQVITLHRVVMVLHGLDLSNCIVDHINGNPFDNKFSNLRCANYTINARNQKLHTNNTSGICGVSYDKCGDRWRAIWNEIDGSQGKKSFSCKKMGYQMAFGLAVNYRESKIRELNTKGAGYSDRHGLL